MRDEVMWLPYDSASDPQDAGDEMCMQDRYDLQRKQEEYERLRGGAAQRHRATAGSLIDEAVGQAAPGERDRLLNRAQQELRRAADPLPEHRQRVERLERIAIRSVGRPAVLVRPTNPFQREKYHRGPDCSHLNGRRRRLTEARWITIGEAVAVGYEPCNRCRPAS